MKTKVFASVVLTAILLCACNSQPKWQRAEGAAWNTVYHIIYQSDENLDDSIMEVFNIVDNSLSAFNDHSVVTLINTNASKATDEHFRSVLETSRKICEASEGAFDPTVGPLVDLWGFGRKERQIVEAEITEALIDSVKSAVGIADCRLEAESLIKKSAATRFDFSAIAKGYGCDLMADMFRRHGIDNFLIEIGGELSLGGISHRSSDWVVQIDAPVTGDDSHIQLLKIPATDCGIATSGNYRNYRDLGSGRRVGHTISPATGRPIATEILSVTVKAPTAAEADALATACMAMPLATAVGMIEKMENVEALFVLETSDKPLPVDDLRIIFSDDTWTALATPGFPSPMK